MHLTQVYPFCRRSAKNFHSWWKFDKVLAKLILHSFFETQYINGPTPTMQLFSHTNHDAHGQQLSSEQIGSWSSSPIHTTSDSSRETLR